jgi:hypothetical protein
VAHDDTAAVHAADLGQILFFRNLLASRAYSAVMAAGADGGNTHNERPKRGRKSPWLQHPTP